MKSQETEQVTNVRIGVAAKLFISFLLFFTPSQKKKKSQVTVTKVSLAAVWRKIFTNRRTRKGAKLVTMAEGWQVQVSTLKAHYNRETMHGEL